MFTKSIASFSLHPQIGNRKWEISKIDQIWLDNLIISSWLALAGHKTAINEAIVFLWTQFVGNYLVMRDNGAGTSGLSSGGGSCRGRVREPAPGGNRGPGGKYWWRISEIAFTSNNIILTGITNNVNKSY